MADKMQLDDDRQVIICGGGIVGCATAYFLTLKGIRPILVEKCAIACAASGHAGGFLAKGWGSNDTDQLHQLGFDLHAQLAEDLGISSFRRLPTLQVGGRRRGAPPKDFPWVDKAGSELMDEDTAQVNPAEITQKMFDAAVANGASLLIGSVGGLQREGDKITGVLVDNEILPCTDVIITMGPWSVHVQKWLPEVTVPMQGVLSTSLLFKMPKPVDPPCALFCAEDDYGCHLEVNPRVDSTVYVCGCGGSKYLDNDMIAALPPDEVKPDPKRVQTALTALRTKTSVTGEVEPESNACIRPCPRDAKPMIGQVLDNAYMACGHNCWGILWGPVTGQIVAELVVGNPSPTPLKAFDPLRFSAGVGPSNKRGRGRHKADTPVGEQW